MADEIPQAVSNVTADTFDKNITNTLLESLNNDPKLSGLKNATINYFQKVEITEVEKQRIIKSVRRSQQKQIIKKLDVSKMSSTGNTKWKKGVDIDKINRMVKHLNLPTNFPTTKRIPISGLPSKGMIEGIRIPIRFVSPRMSPMVGVIPKLYGLTTLARTVALVSRATLITSVVGIIFQTAVEVSVRGQLQRMVRFQKEMYKKITSQSLVGLNGIVQDSLAQAGENIDLNIKVNTDNFNKALSEYMKNTRRDITEVVNTKAYWIAINAIKETYKTNKQHIRTSLEQPSNIINGLTVAEAIVVQRNRKSFNRKMTRTEMKREARKMIGKRVRAVGFLKSGWIPAAKVLAPHVKKRLTVGVESFSKGKPKGGAKPVSRTIFTNNHVASVWNNIIADGDPKSQSYMKRGLQTALDNESRSMMSYVEEKMRKNAAKFNNV